MATHPKQIQIGITGCMGRMGQTLVRAIHAQPTLFELVGGTERPGSEVIDHDIGSLLIGQTIGAPIYDTVDALIERAELIIDFTAPSSTLEHAKACAGSNTAIVIGTTGLTDKERNTLREYAKKIPIVHAHNMSIGVNVLLNLVESLAEKLTESDFDIEVLEMHHKHKIDAPSGTALSLGEAARKGRQKQTGTNPAFKLSREGRDDPRTQGEIGFATLRGGSVIGEHSVIFSSEEERITISHHAESRGVFAAGALRAALWLNNREPGFYSMQDVMAL